jgi:hypothetical protein
MLRGKRTVNQGQSVNPDLDPEPAAAVVRQNHIRLKKSTFRRATPNSQMHVQALVFGHQSSGSPCTP